MPEQLAQIPSSRQVTELIGDWLYKLVMNELVA
jgi:hypothetical protein